MPNSPYGFYLGAAGSERQLSALDAELTQSIEDNIREVRTLSGALVRYKAPLHKIVHWQFRYSYLPGLDGYVLDGGMGYNALRALKLSDVVMNLIVPTDNVGPTSYAVRFMSGAWSEHLLVRRGGDYFVWQLNFELVEAS